MKRADVQAGLMKQECGGNASAAVLETRTQSEDLKRLRRRLGTTIHNREYS